MVHMTVHLNTCKRVSCSSLDILKTQSLTLLGGCFLLLNGYLMERIFYSTSANEANIGKICFNYVNKCAARPFDLSNNSS